jgi:deoxyhypusine synthase
MGGIIKTLIERGFVDWIITTGANVYHEDHFAWGLPIKQGHFEVDDMKLYEKEIVRIRDVFIKFYETLEAEYKKCLRKNLLINRLPVLNFVILWEKLANKKQSFQKKVL